MNTLTMSNLGKAMGPGVAEDVADRSLDENMHNSC